MTVYIVNYSDPGKGSITVNTGTVDYTTSIGLVGHKSYDYGTVVAEGFLHLLENFASSTPPANPTQGQLWYRTTAENSSNISSLLVHDGGKWLPTNGVHQTGEAPTSAKVGDLWVDTSTQQLKIYDGASWIIPSPGFNFSEQTGAYPETIRGTDGKDYFVIKNFLGGEVISILTKDAFTPLISIDGFVNLAPGLNLTSKSFDNQSVRLNGVAAEAAALRVTSPITETVLSNSFFRKDVPQTLNYLLTVNNDAGVRVGVNSPTFIFEKIDNNGVITSTKDSSKIIFRIEKNGTRNAILTVDGDQRGVSINKSLPDSGQSLDVAGNAQISGNLKINGSVTVTGTVESTNSFKTGTVVPFAGPTPAGWLPCNGASYNKIGTYSSLFAVIQRAYGGDEQPQGMFNVPNIPPIATINGPSINYIIKV